MIPTEMRTVDLSQSVLSCRNLRTDRFLDLRVIFDLKRLCHNILDHFVPILARRPIQKDRLPMEDEANIRRERVLPIFMIKTSVSVFIEVFEERGVVRTA